ncbi:hypothetical protein [Micavibrio aeruginosavorus]|uniref:hypothetical protein n=1 Tax=Micavibrio aeruginosavorus TaxID=349221 RepID=UPI003F4A9A53
MTTSFSRTTSRILAAIFLSAVVTNAVAEDAPHQNDPLIKQMADYIAKDVETQTGVKMTEEEKKDVVKGYGKRFARNIDEKTCRDTNVSTYVGKLHVRFGIDICKKNDVLIVGKNGIRPIEPLEP